MEQIGTGTSRRERPDGRKDASKTPAAMDTEKLRDDLPSLKKLLDAKEEASDEYNKALVKTAEKSGLLSTTVNAAVKAYAGDEDDFAEAHRKVKQLKLALDAIAKDK